MEDLGEAVENFVETFSCTEEASSRLPEKTCPVVHGNLLAASPKYGYSFAAVGSSIAVYSHASIRDGDAKPDALVDLAEGNVTSIHSLALGSHDTVLAHVTIDSRRFVIILNIHALAAGKIDSLPSPSRETSAFAVGSLGPIENFFVLATVEEECVQLHSLSARGTTPSTNISISKPICAAVSPDNLLLAVGTERGSVVVYDTKSGKTLTTVVEVESGWVPFSVHFADNRAILVSYNCDGEVRHVVWHLSLDGTDVSGHSALGEICLASLSFDSDNGDDSDEVPSAPTITCISLHEWEMCVIGSSKSGDVEIIKKTDNGWEVWKFDEGKSPTLPNDDNDDDTCCLGLAFDVNNTKPLPGPDAASPKINPMPRVIVYTSDSLLLPFTLIDGTPGIKCDAVRPASGLLRVPENLRPIQTALVSPDYGLAKLQKQQKESSTVPSEDTRSRPRKYDHPLFPTQSEQVMSNNSESDSSATETFEDPKFKESTAIRMSKTRPPLTSTAASSLPFSSFEKGPNSGYDEKGVRSFLGNFSFSDTSKADPISPAITATPRASEMNVSVSQPEPAIVPRDRAKREVLLAPSLSIAEAEASRGDLLGLLKSIMTEMSEELMVSTEAEHLVSHEISSQKDGIVSSITETRKQLSKLLEETRGLFRNEAELRTTVSKTLSKVLAMSREYEKISLEFRVREADGFSRSLRAEEKEIDEKISHKETEVIRSITAIEGRLNAEAKFQTRKTSPAEVVQQVYSSLSLQGIRIKRIRSLLTALKERMDNQDKGGRLSHLGLSLARLETLNIHDEEVPAQSPSTDAGRKRLSGGTEIAVTRNIGGNESHVIAAGIHGDDTQLLSADVRTVMRRLAMSGGRASITTIVPHDKPEQGQRAALNETRVGPIFDDPTIVGLRDNPAIAESQPSDILATNLPEPGTSAFRSSKSWSTVNVRRPHESKALQQDHDGHSQITAPLPITSSTSSSHRTAKADGRPSNTLPPKRPPSQPLLAPSFQPSSAPGFLSKSTVLGNLKKDERYRQSHVSNVPSEKPHADGKDLVAEVNKSAVNQSKNAIFSMSAGDVTGYPQKAFETQNKSGPNHEKQYSDTSNSLSAKPAPGLEKRRNSGAIPFADLPPDDDVHEQTEDNTSAPIFETSEKSRSVPFASLPPDEDVSQHHRNTASTLSFEKPKKSSPVPFAGLPPDDGLPKEKDSESTVLNLAQSENKTRKSESPSGLFAALPPDPDESQTPKIPKEKKTENQQSLRPQEQKDRAQLPGLFAALPPDSDDTKESRQSGTDASKRGEGTVPFGGNKSGRIDPASQSPEKTTGAFGTNDLFATLPPEDSGKERTKSLAAFSMGSGLGNNMSKNVIEQTEESKVQAAVAGNNVGTHSVDGAMSSLFSDGMASKSPAKESIFGSGFETSQQSSAPFGKASLFGAHSTTQQSIADVTEPRMSSSMDATSTDDSDEEPARFGGGMDTTSGTGSAFGASSSTQNSKNPFGFGASLSESTQTTGFTQSGVSPFASFGSTQPFGQSSPSQPSPQAGFGSLAGSQSSFTSSFPTSQPSFGEMSGFGAASDSPTFGMQSSFGASSQMGAPSSFGMPSQLGANSAPFGSSSSSFGGGMTEAKFGDSAFGVTSSLGSFTQNTSGSGFGNSFSSSGASPFGQAAGGNAFGGASGGGSGFAALAGGSQSGQLIFGSGNGPPAFTSAAFSQRRA